jgi:DHA2 family multidrug resistance protein
MASIGLIVALPQLVLGFAVSLLLYQKWVDARLLLSAGLGLIAMACLSGAQLTSDWNRDQFVFTQVLQALGQPMAIVSMLFLITSVVQPAEGPFVAGTINGLRAFGSLAGAGLVTQFMTVCGRFHADVLLDHAATVDPALPNLPGPSLLAHIIGQQALVLSIADAYRVLAVLALLMIPLALRFAYIAPLARGVGVARASVPLSAG